MPRRNTIIAILALGLLAGVLLERGPGRKWREAAQIRSELEWIKKATRQLETVGPPPIEIIQGAVTGRWATPDYLIFSNGWAAYAMHSLHDNDGMDDIALLRTSDGPFYLSRCHLCCGITSELLTPEGELPQPADASDFIERKAPKQEWSLYSPDGRLWCAVRSPHATRRKASKGVWAWIGSASGTNETTLFERRYEVSGSYLSWTTRWVSSNEVAVNVYDNGPRDNPYWPKGPPPRDLATFRFSRDSKSGRFVESNLATGQKP